jgi:hypothetical protein
MEFQLEVIATEVIGLQFEYQTTNNKVCIKLERDLQCGSSKAVAGGWRWRLTCASKMNGRGR